jgi:uncharacterized protein (UPF0276 family)
MASNTLSGAGISLKPEHFGEADAARAAGLWFEVHAENYMVDGGPRIGWLERIRASHPVSLHGVGLSLAGDAPLDARHLARLAALAQRIEPMLVSEHLAWSVQGGSYLPDLLPFPRSHEALARIADNVDRLQCALGRRIAVENPSHYLRLEGYAWDETDFLAELCRRSGCGLLLDLNNIHVSAHNLGFDAVDYLSRLPLDQVMEIHLAGHSRDPMLGDALLIDSHDAPVAPAVWSLYETFIAQAGPRPTLIERDAELPSFDELMAERAQAHALAAQGVASAGVLS